MYLSLSQWRGGAGTDKADRPQAPLPRFKVSSIILTLGVVSMMTDVSSESVAAVLPLYITGALGLSMVAYGFLEGLHQGLSAVVRIAAGWTADRTDQPKKVALLGYGLSMAARAGLIFAQGFGAITAVVGVDRLGKGIRTAPRDAMITAAAQPEHLARSFGVHRMLDTIGATLGPLLAYLVLLVVPGGYHVVFMVSLAFAVLGVSVLWLLVPNRGRNVEPGRAGPGEAPAEPGAPGPAAAAARPSLRLLNTPALRRLMAAAALLGLLTVGDGFIYLALFSHGGFTPEWFPLLYVGTNVVYLAAAVPLGRLADRWGRARVFVAGHGALVLAYLCAAVPTLGWAPVAGCLALLGVFYAATDGVLAALAGQLAPAGNSATGIAAAQTVVAVARLLASTGFGLLWIAFGAAASMAGAAVVLALAVPAAGLLLARTRRPEPAR